MRFLLIPALALGLSGLVQPALATPSIPSDTRVAAAHVESVGGKAVAVLAEPRLSAAARESRLRAVLDQGFGIATICGRIIGTAWTAAAPSERRAFCGSFRDYLLSYLVGLLEDEAPEGFDVTEAERIDGQDIRVRTSVERFGLPLAAIEWIVRDAPDGPEILDVVTDGVSLIGTYQSEFRSYVRREGIEALTVALDRKAAAR